jgi:hypothetical protein
MDGFHVTSIWYVASMNIDTCQAVFNGVGNVVIFKGAHFKAGPFFAEPFKIGPVVVNVFRIFVLGPSFEKPVRLAAVDLPFKLPDPFGQSFLRQIGHRKAWPLRSGRGDCSR